jgi:hypothetical protein
LDGVKKRLSVKSSWSTMRGVKVKSPAIAGDVCQVTKPPTSQAVMYRALGKNALSIIQRAEVQLPTAA